MTIKQAKKIITEQGINWTNYFDLNYFKGKDKLLNKAIERIQMYLIRGI